MHLDEENLQRLVDGELSARAEASARRHLEECSACRERLEAAGSEKSAIHTLLGTLDRPVPRFDSAAVLLRPPRRESRRGRWAAAILVAFVLSGAAYAAPGSPLPALVTAVVHWIANPPATDATLPHPGAELPAEPAEPPNSGIAVAPGEALLIQFIAPQTDGTVRVFLFSGERVTVRGPAGAATFTTDVDRLIVDNRGSAASFEVQIPAGAPRVEIRVGDRTLFLKEGPSVAAGRETGASGTYVIDLTGS